MRRATASGSWAAQFAHAHDDGRVPAGLRISFLLLLKDRTAARQAADLNAVYRPHTRAFGHFMSPSRFAATYGPSPANIRQIGAVLRPAGLSVTWHAGDDWLVVAGPVRRVEAMFRVLDAYTSRHHLQPLHPILKAGPRLAPQGETELDLEVVHAIALGFTAAVTVVNLLPAL